MRYFSGAHPLELGPQGIPEALRAAQGDLESTFVRSKTMPGPQKLENLENGIFFSTDKILSVKILSVENLVRENFVRGNFVRENFVRGNFVREKFVRENFHLTSFLHFSTWGPLVPSARFSAIGLSMDMFIF